MRGKLAFGSCLLLATVAMLFTGCSDMDEENDIFVTNVSGCSLARITLDGQDRGPFSEGETRKFDDVSDGVHTLLAFERSGDTEPCDSHTTDNLNGGEDDYWTCRCDCQDEQGS